MSSGCSATVATTWVAERTRALSWLHVLLAELHPGGTNRGFSATRAAALLRRTHPMTAVDLERKRIARELLADVRRLDREITTAGQAIRTPVRENGITLTEVYGSARCWLPSCWATLATSPASRAGTTSPATPAPHRWRPAAGMCAAIG